MRECHDTPCCRTLARYRMVLTAILALAGLPVDGGRPGNADCWELGALSA